MKPLARSLILAGAFAPMLAGCDRCLGVGDCESPPHVGVTGQVIVASSGAVVPNAEVQLLLAYASRTDTARSTTDARGVFDLDAPASPAEAPTVRLRILPPGLPGYRTDSLACAPVTARGEGCVLGLFYEAPRLTTLRHFVFRGSPGVSIPPDIRITFTPTGGSALFGDGARAQYQGIADSSGNLLLFPANVFAESGDPVVGDLRLELPPPYGTTLESGYRARPFYRYDPSSYLEVAIGPSLAYQADFTDSATALPLEGVAVAFTPSSGIAIEPPVARAVSIPDGRAIINPWPKAPGAVTGTFTITPRGSAATSVGPMTLTTFNADTARRILRYRVGRTGILYPLPIP